MLNDLVRDDVLVCYTSTGRSFRCAARGRFLFRMLLRGGLGRHALQIQSPSTVPSNRTQWAWNARLHAPSHSSIRPSSSPPSHTTHGSQRGILRVRCGPQTQPHSSSRDRAGCAVGTLMHQRRRARPPARVRGALQHARSPIRHRWRAEMAHAARDRGGRAKCDIGKLTRSLSMRHTSTLRDETPCRADVELTVNLPFYRSR